MRKDQSLRFCHCIDSLALYANKKLNMYDDMFEKNSKFLNQEFRHDVLNEIFWYERDIIDEYVKVNEEGMLESTLQEIRNWKHAIADYFLVAKVTEDYAILSNTDFSFKVVGITQKINEVCPNAPTWVNTTLLTFEGEITFAMSMSEFNIDYGIEAKKMLKEESKKILDGKIIEYADDFIQLSPKANKKIKDRKKKKANKKNPFDESQPGKMKTSYVKPSKGTHESPLKGLSGEERNNEMDKNLNVDTKNAIHKILDAQYLDIAKNYAVAHKPITKYADFVKTCKDVDKSWQQNSVSELIDKLEHIFGLKDELAYSLIEMLEDNDWVYTIDLESDDYWLLDVDLLIPYGNLFYYNEKFTWVVFEEFRDAIKSANWEAINVMHEINSAVIDTCNKLVEMCGVLEASDVFKQYTNWYPDFDFWKDADNFASRLEFLAEVCEKECMFVISNPTDDKLSQVLINKRLIEDYDLYDDDIDEDDEEFNQRLEDFDEELLRIVQHQCRFKFSVFPKELRDQAAIEYYLSIPEIQEFRDFFDERVPDDMDAYQYSEVLTEHLIFSQRNGEVGASNIGDFIDGNGLDFSEDEFAEFLNRYTNAANTLPRWENYGHSPAELFNDPSLKNSEEEYQKNLRKWGMGIASSEAHKNIGRNEPCPCGSGKKYKKCCGKLV